MGKRTNKKPSKMNCKEIVKVLLIKSPELRDDDNRLIANIWLQEAGGTAKASQMSGFDFLSLLALGKLTTSESIRRCRQKIQEQEPELRGKSYQARQEKATHIKELLKKF
jgi:hypothetical protein